MDDIFSVFHVIFFSTGPDDYDRTPVDMTFRPCDRRECDVVPIVNDCHMELDETFTISLQKENALIRILINSSELTFTITDSDRKTHTEL